ncbi:amidohydrolase family protein [Virgibacillus ainsalahensis]
MIIDCSNTLPEFRFDGSFEADPKNSKYVELFGSTWARWAGISKEDFNYRLQTIPQEKVMDDIYKVLKNQFSFDKFLEMLNKAGITYHAIHNMDYGRDKHEKPVDHTYISNLMKDNPGKFIGFAGYNPHKGTESIKTVRKALLEQGYKAVVIPPYEHGLTADDRRYYPLYSLCDELGVPIWIHSSINYYAETPVSIDHPSNLEKPLMDFKNLKIIAGHGGWPWFDDLLALLLKYDNLFVDISAFRPKYIAQPNTGWDMFMYYADNLIQDQIVFGSDWVTIGIPIDKIISEIEDWDLKPSVREKLMWRNADFLFELGLANK